LIPAYPTANGVVLFQVAVEVEVVKLSDTDTDIAQSVCPGVELPGTRAHPLAVLGGVYTPVAQVYVDVPDGYTVGEVTDQRYTSNTPTL